MPQSEPEHAPEGSEPLPEKGVDDAYPAEPYAAAEAEEVAYDPGAALVDENQYYGVAEVDSDDPDQVYYDPNQAEAELAYEGYAAAKADASETGYANYEPPQVYEGSGIYDDAPLGAPAPIETFAPRKQAPGRALRRPTSGRPAKPLHNYVQRPEYREGISVMTVFITLIALVMLAAVVMAFLQRDMSTVDGYTIDAVVDDKPRNLLVEAQKTMIERKTEISFTEKEVNQYLSHRLSGNQTGSMASIVRFRGVYVDFSSEKVEVVVERELFGLPFTTSVSLLGEEFRRRTIYKPTAWTIGRISFGKTVVAPIVELFVRLRGSLGDEYQTMEQMSRVRFEENLVILDARI